VHINSSTHTEGRDSILDCPDMLDLANGTTSPGARNCVGRIPTPTPSGVPVASVAGLRKMRSRDKAICCQILIHPASIAFPTSLPLTKQRSWQSMRSGMSSAVDDPGHWTVMSRTYPP